MKEASTWSSNRVPTSWTSSHTPTPNSPYKGIVTSGKKQYLQAIYADTAVTKACVDCHNSHPLSPKRDFTINDVLGGMVIAIPLTS